MKIDRNLFDRLLERAEAEFGPRILSLHQKYLALFGTDAVKQVIKKAKDTIDEDGEGLPPLEDYETSFGPIIDQVKQIKQKDIGELDGLGANGQTDKDFTPEPDLTGPGKLPKDSEPGIGSNRTYNFNMKGDWHRYGSVITKCNKLWYLFVLIEKPIPNCDQVNYQKLYRETLLRAMGEAYLACDSSPCKKARMWIESARWGCIQDEKSSYEYCWMRIAVLCVDV